jgi:hypothetical protein
MTSLTFKRVTANGNVVASFALRHDDVTIKKLSILFKVTAESLFLTTDSNEVIFPSGDSFQNLHHEEYFVNGDPVSNNVTQLNRLTNTLDTRGMPAPLNSARAVNGFASNMAMGFAGPTPSLQRSNTVAKDKPFKKSISLLDLKNGKLVIKQNVKLLIIKKLIF